MQTLKGIFIPLETILYWFFLLLLSHGAHEFGHWLAYKYYGYDAKLTISWLTVSVGENVGYRLTPNQSIVIDLSGILVGLYVLFIGHAPFILYTIYLMMSSVDIGDMVTCAEYSKEERKQPIWKILKKELKNYR